MLWGLLNIVQCLLIRSKVLGALVLGRVIAGDGYDGHVMFGHDTKCSASKLWMDLCV